MGRNRRAKEKRIRKVADDVLKSEMQRNAERIPEMVPDSALFEDSTTDGMKKKKIFLHPRPPVTPIPKTADVEYTDIWGEESVKKFERKPKRQLNRQKMALPTSEDSYRSAHHVRKPEEKEAEEEAHDPAVTVTITDADQGMGDSLKGDVPNGPAVDIPAPGPKKKEGYGIRAIRTIPKWYPEEKRKQMMQDVKIASRQIREKMEEELLPEFENTKEIAVEVQEKMKEIAEKPKQEKEDKLMNFIAAEPGYDMEKVPETLSELSGDTRPFARIQRSFEQRRKVGLHE